jgi:uncharacterized zinc-type alcohol dehydrogenase-like protein
MTTAAVGYAAKSKRSDLKPLAFQRRDPGPTDVVIDIQYCGVCHSDVHQARDEWGNTVWPCVPGHELVGRVTAVGASVATHRVGDVVAAGCMVDSCRQCSPCRSGLEQYCEGPHGWTATYNGPMKPDGSNTFGGYTDHVVVDEHFVLRVPPSLASAGSAGLAAVAPLLCSAVTTYSPLRHWKVGPGQKVGVVGLGGLGHVAVKLARALGAEVVVFTTSKKKKEADARRFGASDVVDSKNKKAMQAHASSLDFILSTIPEPHDVNPYVELLKLDGTIVLVGVLAPLQSGTDNQQVAFHRRSVAGSLIGGIAETQEVLDFCAEHNITSEVEVIPIQQINDAYDRVVDGKARYRYVIDLATLEKERKGAKGKGQVA